jgi:hypothetical protein
MLEIRKEINAIAKYLYEIGRNGKVNFDFSSYEDELDIPHLIIDGDVIWIQSFYITEDGSCMGLIADNGDILSTNFDNIPEEWDDEYFELLGLDTLLRDVYYETTESYEYGDYELDFLPKFV